MYQSLFFCASCSQTPAQMSHFEKLSMLLMTNAELLHFSNTNLPHYDRRWPTAIGPRLAARTATPSSRDVGPLACAQVFHHEISAHDHLHLCQHRAQRDVGEHVGIVRGEPPHARTRHRSPSYDPAAGAHTRREEPALRQPRCALTLSSHYPQPAPAEEHTLPTTIFG